MRKITHRLLLFSKLNFNYYQQVTTTTHSLCLPGTDSLAGKHPWVQRRRCQYIPLLCFWQLWAKCPRVTAAGQGSLPWMHPRLQGHLIPPTCKLPVLQLFTKIGVRIFYLAPTNSLKSNNSKNWPWERSDPQGAASSWLWEWSRVSFLLPRTDQVSAQ